MHVCVCVVNDHVEMASSNRATSFSLPCSSDPFRDDSFSTRRPDNTDRIIRPICLVEAKGKLGLEGKDRSPPRLGAETFKKKKKIPQRSLITFRLTLIYRLFIKFTGTVQEWRRPEAEERREGSNGNGIAPRQCQAAIFHAIPLLCD